MFSFLTKFLGVKEYNFTGNNKSLRITKRKLKSSKVFKAMDQKWSRGEGVLFSLPGFSKVKKMLGSQQDTSKTTKKTLNKRPW